MKIIISIILLIGSFGLFAQESQEEVKPYTEKEIEYNWCVGSASWSVLNETTKCIRLAVSMNSDTSAHLKYVAKPCFRVLAKFLDTLEEYCNNIEKIDETE